MKSLFLGKQNSAVHFFIALTVLFLGVGFSGSSQADEFGPVSHDLYFGDINSDGYDDIYLKAKGRIIILAGDINIPITAPAAVSSLLVLSNIAVAPFEYNAPIVDETVDVTSLTKSNGRYLLGDFNGDGIEDVFIHSLSSGLQSLILKGNGESQTPTILQQHLDDATGHSLSSQSLFVKDVNGDGRDDLVIDRPGSVELALIASSNGTFSNLEEPYFPATAVFEPAPHDAGVGTTASQYEVSLDGSANYSIPISVVAGKAGIQPELAFSYNSNGSNGLLGIGWGLGGLSVIHRCPATLAQDSFIDGIDFDSNDRFCLDGQRLVAYNGSYGASGTEYRTADESFTKIVSYGSAGGGPAYFKVWTRDGKVSEYGVTADSRIEAQGKSSVYLWALNKTEDRYGNYLTVDYHEDNTNGDYYPTRIDYTGNAAAGITPYNSVRFEYENRTDYAPAYVSGSIVRNFKRLSKAKSYSSNTLVREYRLVYGQTNGAGESRLQSITECGANNVCFSSLDFTYADATAALGSGFSGPAWGNSSGFHVEQYYSTIKAADVNGDGHADMCVRHSTGITCQLGSSSGFSSQTIQGPAWGNAQGFGAPQYYSTLQYPDINGDGKSDFCIRASSGIVCYLSTGTGTGAYVAGPAWSDAQGYNVEMYYSSIQYPDINGDGKSDFCNRDSNGVSCYLSTGTGIGAYVAGPAWSNAQGFSAPQYYSTLQYPDINGDSMADFCVRANSGIICYLSTGTGTGAYVAGPALSDAAGFANAIYYSTIAYPDVNGDGMSDFCYRQSSGITCYLSTGTGTGNYVSGPAWSNTAGWSNSLYYSTIRYPDLNGDGKSDICTRSSSGIDCYLSDGNNFSAGYVGGPAWGNSSGWHYPEHYTTIQYPDINGNGMPEVCGRTTTGIYCYSMGAGHNNLTSVTNGFGVATSFSYKLMTDNSVYTQGSGASYPVQDVKAPFHVVNQSITSNGIGGVFTTSYSYKGLKAHLQGIGSLGFSEMTTRNEDTGIQTTTTFNQDYANHTHGSVDRIVTVADNGTTLSDTQNTWNSIAQGSGSNLRWRRQLQSTEVTKRDLNGAFLHREMNSYTYDSYDNMGTVTSQVYDSINQLLRTKVTTNNYTNDTGNWLLGLLTKSTVSATVTGQPTLTRKSSWTYDASTGRKLTEKILHPDTEVVLNETRYEDIDSFGNHRRTVLTGPDFATRESTVIYDSTGRFVTSATNPLNHTGTSTYYADGHINAGLVETTTDANGIVTHYQYDSFGRSIEVTAAYGSDDPVKSFTSFQWCEDMSALCPANAVYGITKYTEGGTGSFVYVDQLGREVKRSTQMLDGRFAHVGNAYNALGHNHKVCDPYYDGETEYFTDIEYDVLGRATKSTFADGRVDTVTYNGLVRTSRNDINGLNQKKIEYRDSLGNLTKVRDNDNNDVIYTYDSFGNMLTVVDPDNNTTSITYDDLSRKTEMDDPDKGIWTYTYNGLNQLISQTNAKNETLCSAYDKLGRLVKRIDNYPGSVSTGLGLASDATNQCANAGATPEVATWVYDTASGNAKGKVHQVSGQNGYQETFSYDSYGRTTQMTQVANGESFSVDTTYDQYHRVDTTTYPGPSNRLQIQNVYNNQGFAVQLKNAANGDIYYHAGDMDARGNITGDTLGNGVVTLRDFDPQTGRIDRIRGYGLLDQPTAPSIQDLTFQFDKVGNLTHRQDALQQFTEDFTYDTLNRLKTTSADFGNADIRTTNITYDALGNILSKTGVGTYTYGGTCNGQQAGPHAVTSITAPKSTSYCYDANGNMVSGDGRTISYTPFDKPEVITKDGNTSTITYGPGRNRYSRVDQTSAGTTSYTYVGGLYEKVILPSNQTEERHFVGGFAIVTIKDRTASSAGTEQTRYLHKDHLGSTTLITNELGQIVEEFSFDPWGKRRAPNLAKLIVELGSWSTLTDDQKNNLTIPPLSLASAITNKGFTGHEQLDPVGLIHMNGRVYDPEIGRFVSADPFIQDRTNLQALNRYSYVQNNPLSYTDPSGYFLKKLFKKLVKVIKAVVNTVAKAFRSIARAFGKLMGRLSPTLRSILIVTFCGPNPLCYVAWSTRVSMSITYANGGSANQVLKAGAIAFVRSSFQVATGTRPKPLKFNKVSAIIKNLQGNKATGSNQSGGSDEESGSLAAMFIGGKLKDLQDKAETKPLDEKKEKALAQRESHRNRMLATAQEDGTLSNLDVGIISGAAGGAVSGFISGVVVGATAGAASGAFAAGVGAIPGAIAGAVIGGISGLITGGISGGLIGGAAAAVNSPGAPAAGGAAGGLISGGSAQAILGGALASSVSAGLNDSTDLGPASAGAIGGALGGALGGRTGAVSGALGGYIGGRVEEYLRRQQ